MRLYFLMFITADCFLFLLKLRWPRNKSIYDLEWDTLETNRKKNKLTLMFKLNHKLMDMKTEEYLVPNSETRTSKILSHWSMEYLKLAKTFLSLLLFSSNHLCLQWLLKNNVISYNLQSLKAESSIHSCFEEKRVNLKTSLLMICSGNEHDLWVFYSEHDLMVFFWSFLITFYLYTVLFL